MIDQRVVTDISVAMGSFGNTVLSEKKPLLVWGGREVKTEAISVSPGLLTEANDACASIPASLSPVAVRSKSESLAPLVAANRHGQGGSDEILLVQVGKGDREALSILFQRHAQTVYNVARRILKDDSEAEDLLQELFLFIFQKADLEGRVREACEKFLIDSKGVLY